MGKGQVGPVTREATMEESAHREVGCEQACL